MERHYKFYWLIVKHSKDCFQRPEPTVPHDGSHLKTGCIRVRSFRTGHCLRCKEMCVEKTYLVYHSSVCLGLLGSLQHHTGGQDWSKTDKWTCPAYLSTHTETGTHTCTDGGTVSYVSNLMEIWPGLTSWKSDPLVNGVAGEMRGWKRER